MRRWEGLRICRLLRRADQRAIEHPTRAFLGAQAGVAGQQVLDPGAEFRVGRAASVQEGPLVRGGQVCRPLEQGPLPSTAIGKLEALWANDFR